MIDMANLIIRSTHRGRKSLLRDAFVLDELRARIMAARRFILDDEMSYLLGALSHSYYDVGGPDKARQVLTSQRHSALLPFEHMLVQFSGKEFRRGMVEASKRGAHDITGTSVPVDGDIIDPVCWLLHSSGGVVSMCQFFDTQALGMPDDIATPPFRWVYTPQDIDLQKAKIVSRHASPYHKIHIENKLSEIYTGCVGVPDLSIGLAHDGRWRKDDLTQVSMPNGERLSTHKIAVELGGNVRYLLVFLQLLNDVPVVYSNDAPTSTRSYFAGGQIRKPVQSEFVRIVLPNKTRTVREYAERLDRDIKRGVIRHKDHPVRGHWRVYIDVDATQLECQQGNHAYAAADLMGRARCIRPGCAAFRVWIKDHRRGDKQLGSVEHNYLVGAR